MKKVFSLLILLFVGFLGWGQISITAANSPISEDFNSMDKTATATLPSGWKMGTDWGTATTTTTHYGGTSGTGILTGTSGGGFYNFADGIAASSSDRAIGFLTSSGYSSPRSIMCAIINNTGSSINAIRLTWKYEKYRSGTRAFGWTFFHGSNSSLVSTSNTNGDLAYAADANNTTISNPPSSTTLSFTITGLSIADGTTYYFRWAYTGVSGSTNAQGLGIDDFTITVGTDLTALPVTWQSFTAEKQRTVSLLKWSTASEQNTKDFEVQHSTNTLSWTPLGTLAAAGNSTTTRQYSFTHATPFKGNVYNYYRILQRDLDGKFSYSKIASLIYDEPGPDVFVYPNPATEVVTLYLAESQDVRLINVAGATVWKGTLSAGRNQIPLTHLAKGVYWVVTGSVKKQLLIQ
jgi:hypothetical protein